MLKWITWRAVWNLIFCRFYVLSLNPFPLRLCNYSSPRQPQLPFNMAFLHSWPVRKVRWHSYVPFRMARSLVFSRSSLIRIRLAGECLSSCTRATSSFLARLLSRNTNCIEFSDSTFKVEFTLTSITRWNSVLSLCDNFRCHYQWSTCRLTVLTTPLAQLYALMLLLSSDPTFPPSNKQRKLRVCSSNFGCFCRTRTIRLSTPYRQRISTSSHRRLEKLFPSFLRLLLTVTDPCLNFLLTLLTLLTNVWTLRVSYLTLHNLCGRFRLRLELFGLDNHTFSPATSPYYT